MKLLIKKIKRLCYWLVGVEWIVGGVDCRPVPVYVVEVTK